MSPSHSSRPLHGHTYTWAGQLTVMSLQLSHHHRHHHTVALLASRTQTALYGVGGHRAHLLRMCDESTAWHERHLAKVVSLIWKETWYMWLNVASTCKCAKMCSPYIIGLQGAMQLHECRQLRENWSVFASLIVAKNMCNHEDLLLTNR